MSRHLLDCCIVWDGAEATWVTPSHATRLLESNPRVELIEELHPYYDFYKDLAGPKPQKYVEDQDAKVNRGGDDRGAGMSEGDGESDPVQSPREQIDFLDPEEPDPGPGA